ncbi:MAG: DNA polymerase III subunit gamma/tau C-terminal domain-containing protein, partial [Pontibacterium sp.]
HADSDAPPWQTDNNHPDTNTGETGEGDRAKKPEPAHQAPAQAPVLETPVAADAESSPNRTAISEPNSTGLQEPALAAQEAREKVDEVESQLERKVKEHTELDAQRQHESDIPVEYADYTSYDEAPNYDSHAEPAHSLEPTQPVEQPQTTAVTTAKSDALSSSISSGTSTDLKATAANAKVEPAEITDELGDLPTDINGLKPYDWSRLAHVLGLRGMTANLANNISLEEADAAALRFHYRPAQATLLNDVQRDRIRDALYNYFNAKPAIQFEEGVITFETPSERVERKRKERHQQAIEALQNDEKVAGILTMFSAKLDLETVEPIDPE